MVISLALRKTDGFNARSLHQFMEMTEEKLQEIEAMLDRDFAEVRKRVQQAVDALPKKVTLEDALEQVRQFGNVYQCQIAHLISERF